MTSIIIKFSGGIGNQMFQFAFMEGLRERYPHATFFIDKKNGYSENPDHYGFDLDRVFNLISLSEAPESLIEKSGDYSLDIFSRIKRKIYKKKSHIKYYDLNYYKYNISVGNNYYFDGYWQSFKYFPTREILLNFFSFNIKPEKIDNLKNKIEFENSVGIHIRGNGYINDLHSYKILGSVLDGSKYYHNAINYCLERISNPVFFVFTDDIEYAKKTLKPINQQFIFIDKFGEKEDYFYIMYLMSICKHNIIGNSTFAWWGAWLNSNKLSIKCAPDKWINETTYNIDDIIPNDFIKIQIR